MRIRAGHSYQRQSGLALITVLLIFAIVSVLAVAMIDRLSAVAEQAGHRLGVKFTNTLIVLSFDGG